MQLLGPFPDRRPDLKQPGWFEHIVFGPVRAVIYTTGTYDDDRVQAALAEFFETAHAREDVVAPTITPRSAMRAIQLAEAVRRARELREERPSRPRGDDGA